MKKTKEEKLKDRIIKNFEKKSAYENGSFSTEVIVGAIAQEEGLTFDQVSGYIDVWYLFDKDYENLT